MDAIRGLRPLWAGMAGLTLLASAAASEPPCEVTAGAVCVGDGSALCGCRSGQRCTGGAGCRFAGRGRYAGQSANGGPSLFRDADDGDNFLVGSEQHCHEGKLWPPYPRPRENGDLSTQFHAAYYWPHPYKCWDRSWVKQAMAMQTANGWMQATTLCCYHFDAKTHCLNDTGRRHLRWILLHAPPEHRMVYVESADPSVSETRRSSVESEAVAIAGSLDAPIILRPVNLAGRPARELDALRRSELDSMPPPRLVPVSSAGGGILSGAP